MKIFEAVSFVFKRALSAAPLLFIFYLLLMFILSFSTIINIAFFKIAIDSVTSKKMIFGLSIIGVLIIRFGYEIIFKVIDKTAEYLWNLIDLKQTIYNTEKFIDKLSTLDLSNFENPQTFDKIWRSFNRIAWQMRFYLDASIKLLSNFIGLSASIVIFFMSSPINALLIIAANIIPIVIKSKLGNQSFNIYKSDSETRRKYEYSSSLLTNRDILVEIKQFQGFGFVKQKMLSIYGIFTNKQAQLFRKAYGLLSLTEILPVIAISIFLIGIAQQLQNQTMTTGTFVFLFTNIFVFQGALSQLGNNLSVLISDGPFIHDAIDFYNIKRNINFPSLSHHQINELKNKLKNPIIRVENVSFHYPNSEKNVLTNVNLTIPFGQNIAIIGENGAGKTTLVKLLLRVYDPSEGNIFINDINIKEIPENIIFQTFSTLFQSYGKFYLTIRENMELANGKKLADEEYIDALKLSNAWNYVKTFPLTLDQQLGPTYTDGVDLSGGQWQQLAIAKALIRQTPLLILDEPTSSVDAKAEMEIFDRLNKETKNCTVIFISHRFSTIKDTQRIVVIDKGKVIEDGNHETLMKNKGKYSLLYSLQAERYLRE